MDQKGREFNDKKKERKKSRAEEMRKKPGKGMIEDKVTVVLIIKKMGNVNKRPQSFL